MKMPLRCHCGAVRGEMDTERAYARATCYCKDCRAFARFLGVPGVLDASGGTDIVPVAPAAVRITAGGEHVVCMSLSPKGLLRWYAACCRTPLANTPRPVVQFMVAVTDPRLGSRVTRGAATSAGSGAGAGAASAGAGSAVGTDAAAAGEARALLDVARATTRKTVGSSCGAWFIAGKAMARPQGRWIPSGRCPCA